MNKTINLIKAFGEAEHALNFQRGNIILRSLDYFRLQCESQNGDRKEGRAINKTGGNTLLNTSFVLCMHDNAYDRKASQYGKHKVLIQNPQNILDQINSIIVDAGINIMYDDMDQVKYYDDQFCLAQIPFEKLAFYKPEYSSDTFKSICFKDDREWRIAITLYDEEPASHGNIEFKYFRMQRLGRKSSIEELSYEERHKSKYNNTGIYGLEDHYVELHFKNIKFDSCLIR